jgi:hypothetical protein
MPRRRLWLCLPPLLAFVCDAALTLAHQPVQYWQGDYTAVWEGNPLVRTLMEFGPAATLAAGLAYALAFCTALLWLRTTLARVLAFLLTFGHSVGAASWLIGIYGVAGVVAAVGLALVMERLLRYSWLRAGGGDRGKPRLTGSGTGPLNPKQLDQQHHGGDGADHGNGGQHDDPAP